MSFFSALRIAGSSLTAQRLRTDVIAVCGPCSVLSHSIRDHVSRRAGADQETVATYGAAAASRLLSGRPPPPLRGAGCTRASLPGRGVEAGTVARHATGRCRAAYMWTRCGAPAPNTTARAGARLGRGAVPGTRTTTTPAPLRARSTPRTRRETLCNDGHSVGRWSPAPLRRLSC